MALTYLICPSDCIEFFKYILENKNLPVFQILG